MKNLIVVTLAVVGLAACSSNPTQEYRQPSSLGDSLANSSDAAVNLSGTVVHASVEVSKASFEGSKKISAGLSDVLSASANTVKDVAIIGWGVSRDSSAVVVASANEASKVLAGSARHVITTSGNVFEASLNGSRTAIGVSVDLAKESGTAIVRVGGWVVGSVKVSAETASDAALWTSEKVGNAAAWSVNTTGELVSASGRVVGNVVDASGRAVSFVVDKSGKILAVTSDASVAVIHSTSDALRSIAHDVHAGLQASGNSISGTIQFSAQKTLIVLNWSAKGVSHVSKFISNSIRDILYSAPETRGSSAAAPATGSGSY